MDALLQYKVTGEVVQTRLMWKRRASTSLGEDPLIVLQKNVVTLRARID